MLILLLPIISKSMLTYRAGQAALETYDWAKAAGMQSFQTFHSRCRDVLRGPDFVWPDGVTFVNYPVNDGEDPVTIRKP